MSSTTLRQLEDGPYGGPHLLGDAVVGEMLDAPIDDEGGWGAARILDASVAQVAHSLSTGQLGCPLSHSLVECL